MRRIWFYAPSWYWWGWRTLVPFYRGSDEFNRSTIALGWTVTGQVIIAYGRYTFIRLMDSPKMLRETLCVAQARIGNSPLDARRRDEHIDRLQRLIDECDRNRPLGPDGKHGDRHTATCGCEDK